MEILKLIFYMFGLLLFYLGHKIKSDFIHYNNYFAFLKWTFATSYTHTHTHTHTHIYIYIYKFTNLLAQAGCDKGQFLNGV